MSISIVLLAALTLPIPPDNTVVWEKVDDWSVSAPRYVESTMDSCMRLVQESRKVKMKCHVMERGAALALKTVTITTKTGE